MRPPPLHLVPEKKVSCYSRQWLPRPEENNLFWPHSLAFWGRMDQREKLAPPKPLRLTRTWQRSVSPASLLQFQVWLRCSSRTLPSGSLQKGPVHCWQQLWMGSWTIPDNCRCPLLDWALRARGLKAIPGSAWHRGWWFSACVPWPLGEGRGGGFPVSQMCCQVLMFM